MTPRALIVPLLGALALWPEPARGEPQVPPSASSLIVVLKDLRGRTVGKVTLTDAPNGVLIRGRLKGLPKGIHALHFHEVGKCEPPFKTAGGHFNPTQKTHGMLDPGGAHAGDLPNVVVPKGGKVDFEAFAPNLTLATGSTALLDADGTALVLHAKADDHHTQPSGDAGDRIACGVIGR